MTDSVKSHNKSPRAKQKPVADRSIKEPKLSRTHPPVDLALIDWQRGLRRQFGRDQAFAMENLGDHPIAPNVLERDFEAPAPNRKWLADMTYIRTDEGWLYLALVLDLFARKIVGWAMSDTMEAIALFGELRDCPAVEYQAQESEFLRAKSHLFWPRDR